MQFLGLAVLAPTTGGTAMLARAVFGVVLLCLAVPVIREVWSSLRSGPETGDPPDLDALWKRYRRGEISWDDYLRCKVEGTRRAGLEDTETAQQHRSENVSSAS